MRKTRLLLLNLISSTGNNKLDSSWTLITKNKQKRKKYPPALLHLYLISVTYFMLTVIKTGTNDSLHAVWLKDSVLTATMDKRTRLFFNVSKRSPDNKNSLASFYLARWHLSCLGQRRRLSNAKMSQDKYASITDVWITSTLGLELFCLRIAV